MTGAVKLALAGIGAYLLLEHVHAKVGGPVIKPLPLLRSKGAILQGGYTVGQSNATPQQKSAWAQNEAAGNYVDGHTVKSGAGAPLPAGSVARPPSLAGPPVSPTSSLFGIGPQTNGQQLSYIPYGTVNYTQSAGGVGLGTVVPIAVGVGVGIFTGNPGAGLAAGKTTAQAWDAF